MTINSTKTFQSKSFFLVFCCLLTAAKLLLVGQNEILSSQDDSLAYAQFSVGPWALNYAPGYPMWLRLCALGGFPQRICIEILYLCAVYLVSGGIRKSFGLISALITFFLLAFAPMTYFLFDRGLSDAFFTCLTLFALGITIHLLANRTRSAELRWALLLGFFLGLMAVTRNEDPLLILWGVLVVLALFVLQRDNELIPRKRWFHRKPLLIGLVSAVSCYSVIFVVSFSYYLTDGVFARSIALMPEHSKLLRNLAQIQTGQPQLRFVPISRRSRELAYNVSPSLLFFKSQIENPQDVWHVASRGSGIPEGEIGGGWIWHAFNSKVLPSVGNSRTAAEAIYKKINTELQRAFADGRLKRRFIIHPLVGGSVKELLAQLPASLITVTRSAGTSMSDYPRDEHTESALFDRAFLRRSALVDRGTCDEVQGWVFVATRGRVVRDVVIGSSLSKGAQVEDVARPDVLKSFTDLWGWAPAVVGFRSVLPSSSAKDISISFLLDDGSVVPGLLTRGITKIPSTSVRQGDVYQAIDYLQFEDNARTGLSSDLQSNLVKFFNSALLHKIVASVLILAVVIAGVGFFAYQSPNAELWLFLFGFGCLMWFARVFLYSVIDATAWNADQVRYLAPANVIGFFLLSLALSLLTRSVLKASVRHS